jgi:hypothetical protein
MRRGWWWMSALVVLSGGAEAKVTVTRVNYHGWAGAYRLSNGTVEVVVVPQVGRILRYGYVGGPNVLWENPKLHGRTVAPGTRPKEWVNFGGDKLWPAPQAKWGFPPDLELDGYAHTAEALPDGRLRLTSRPSRKHGIRFLREIALAPSGTGVTLRNTMENTSDQDVEWSVWEVAQTDSPDTAILPLHKGGHFPRGWYVFKDQSPAPGMLKVAGGEVRFRRHPKKSAKIGADSPAGWAAMRKDGLRFTVMAAYEPGKDYPDDGCAQEVWSNPDPDRYMELELLSPLQFLQPGDRYTFTTRWKLERR